MDKNQVLARLHEHIAAQQQQQQRQGGSPMNHKSYDVFCIAVTSAIQFAALLLEKDPTDILAMLVPKDLTEQQAKRIQQRLSSLQAGPEGEARTADASSSPTLKQLKPNENVTDEDEEEGKNIQTIMDLPESLLAIILNFLPFKEMANMFAVSKKWNYLVKNTVQILYINPDWCGSKGNNAVLFAARNCNVKRVYWNITNQDGPDFRLTGLVLHNFFHSVPPLKAVSLHFSLSGSENIDILMSAAGGLSVFSNHTSLELLDMWWPKFSNMQQVVHMLRPLKNLRQLKLNFMCFRNPHHWPSADVLVQVVHKMKTLRILSMKQHYLSDENVQYIVRGLRDIRNLDLSASANPTLSDESMKGIAQHCPKLQSLGLWNQTKNMTISGIGLVLRSCPICKLMISWSKSNPLNFTELVQACPTLLSLYVFVKESAIQNENLIKSVNDAIVASHGRVVFTLTFYHSAQYYNAPITLPISILQRQQETIQIIEKTESTYKKCGKNMDWCNQWEEYLGVLA
jgi:hypothetical protein